MKRPLYLEAINQTMHAVAPLLCLAPMLPWALWGAPGLQWGIPISTLLIGVYRETGQMGVSGDRSWGWRRTVDVLPALLGGVGLALLLR